MSTKIAKLLPLQSWNFVENDALREVLIRDYRELRKVVNAGARKSAIVLCGSILEALLVAKFATAEAQADYRKVFEKDLDVDKMPEWGLESLINISNRLGYLDSDSQRLAHAVQNFRNYIHPGKAMQAMAPVDANSVASAITLLNHVIKRVRPKDVVPPPPPTPEQRFLRKLNKKCRPAEIEAVKQIMEWASHHGLQHHWSSKWIYAPRLRYNGYTYVPLKIKPSGKFLISFRSFLKKPSAFKLTQHRETLRQRLNEEVLEERIGPARVDGQCTFPLALLADPADLQKFLAVFDWMVKTIRQ